MDVKEEDDMKPDHETDKWKGKKNNREKWMNSQAQTEELQKL